MKVAFPSCPLLSPNCPKKDEGPTYHVPAGDVADVDNNVELWGPVLKLTLPGVESGERHNQQEGAVQLLAVVQVGQEGHDLDRFAQTHLICQDYAVVPGYNTVFTLFSGTVMLFYLHTLSFYAQLCTITMYMYDLYSRTVNTP